jgi:hypothetical protein
MRADTWGGFGFMLFWLGFVAFWTCGALGVLGGRIELANLLFASFSIPFWIAGFTMLAGIVWTAAVSRNVKIDRDELWAESRLFRWSHIIRLDRSDVQHARPYDSKAKSTFQRPCSVEIIHAKGSFTLPADTEAEQAWLIAEINSFLKDATPL